MTRVYNLLRQIPAGRVSTYAALSRALQSSPRAVGGALRRNPFSPEVPCHRIITTDGTLAFNSLIAKSQTTANGELPKQTIGGFFGEAEDAPSGVNKTKKLDLLKSEGVLFDKKGNLIEKERLWDEFKLVK
ncbi:hypothetical protein DH86_00003016 [Scytalidium sp. 3C]|nr:hypothetical protein DH86_00003016 [Scytalidium sp. 3C]